MRTRHTATGHRADPVTGPDKTGMPKRPDDESPPSAESPSADSPFAESPSAEPTSDLGEYLTAAAIIGIGLLFWIGAADYSDAARRWPLFLCYIVVGLGAVNLVTLTYQRAIAGRRRAGERSGPGSTATGMMDPAGTGTTAGVSELVEQRRKARAGQRRQVATGLFVLGYAVLGYGAGFLIATAVLLPLYTLLAFKPRRPLFAALVTVALLIFMHLVFAGALNAPLYRGAWMGVDLSWLPF